ncbi:DUF1871 family protein [Bacillus luteolus]|uniref:DUF1871 family protein n=1 Tax=Litchfieldia luteola TaxID=682179 RepID=A0ABR9QG46_9BACI|nr:DUF1871 family protein [Cytobacillus luteolus]MBE4907467.1 DUF1871 family protein [Cytobacillus luteolus]MBP1944234.1 hypothetical protein [Cytobacillus luteolus]
MTMQRDVNLQIMYLLENWDPLGHGLGSYETEAVDVLQAVYQIDDPEKLATKIQLIYEFSFEQLIPLADCRKMAEKLLLIKNDSTCEL